MKNDFQHEISRLEDRNCIYTAYSKNFFYYRMAISQYVLKQGKVPLNPFMLFDYFLLDTIDRNLIRDANHSIINKADELWVFGPVSNGVLKEILIAKNAEKPLRYFKILKPHAIIESSEDAMEYEDDTINHALSFETA
jgi:hypothetical protein